MASSPELEFLGGAGCVTGSRFLLTHGQRRVLVDCGLFQGYKHLRMRNWEPFPVDPGTLDAVLLTHAHIDHSGYLPALVRDGFRGPILGTPATLDLARILLEDAAKLQEEDARVANRGGFSRHHPARPLYTRKDAERAVRHFKPQAPGQVIGVGGLRATFVPNGHILGSASIHVAIGGKSVTFSGDLGRQHDPIMPPPLPPRAARHLVLESTYGGRDHATSSPEATLRDVVLRAEREGEPVLVPAFAIGRAQACLLLLHRLMASGEIPDLPLYLDSPMASLAQRALVRHIALTRLKPEEARAITRRIQVIASRPESLTLARRHGAHVIVSASGMLTGGHALHHLQALGPRPGASIVLAGYQAGGTRGARLLSGERDIKVMGKWIRVKANVVFLENLSAHADASELVAWAAAMRPRPQRIHLVHGEPDQADALRVRLEARLGVPTSVASLGDRIALDV